MARYDTPIAMLTPPEIRFGARSVAGLADWTRARGGRVFVVADAYNAGRIEALGLKDAAVFGEVEPEPGLANLEAAVAAAERAGADIVIGFGGGSAMDLAKLVAVLAGTGRALGEVSGKDRVPPRTRALVQIPTTAGTGSEVGTRALVADPATRNKIATESREMLADLAIVDPDLTTTVPPIVTAATGVDAMAHCTEALTSRRSHPLIDDYAMRGIALVGRFLHRAVADGTDVEARAGLSLAALYGGICLGPVNTTAGHAVAYPLGTRHGIAHGMAVTLIFPHTLAANAEATPAKTAMVCRALGGNDASASFAVAHRFCEGMGLDMRLSAHGVPKDDLPTMAAEAHAIRRLMDFNPVNISKEQILEIYEKSW